jgi:hypothetical protein
MFAQESTMMSRGKSMFACFLGCLILVGVGVTTSDIRIQSKDLKIDPGTGISVDGKVIGVAPCEFKLRTKIRHKVELKSRDGNVRTYFLTFRELKNSEKVGNIPAWFLDPASLKNDFKDYENLASSTVSAATIAEALSAAEAKLTSRASGIRENRYNTMVEPAGNRKLDSSKSKYYPKLTRGQMDSLNDVNGGTMVASSFASINDVTFLEFEIQKIGDQFLVYVLAGIKRN